VKFPFFLSFRLKIAILVFLVTLTFFMLFLLVEDFLIFKDLLKASGWHAARRGIRLGFGFAFSLLVAVSTYFSFHIFYENLHNLIRFIQSWKANEEREEIPIRRNDEIGNLFRSLQIAIYQEDEKREKMIQKTVQSELARLTRQIQEGIRSIPPERVEGLDISIFPKTTQKPFQDLVQIVKTEDGCLGVVAGFDSVGVLESSFKSDLSSILYFLYHLQTKRSNEVFPAIFSGFSSMPDRNLNATIFTIHSGTGELQYICHQEIPPIVWSEEGTRELDRPLRRFLEKGKTNVSSVQNSVLYEKEHLLIVSDRILKPIQLSATQFVNELKQRIFHIDSIHSNSRELTISIANHIAKRYGKKALDRLGIIAIKRK